MKLQDTLSSYFRLDTGQFKAIFILWTILSTIYLAIVWFTIYTVILKDADFDKLTSALHSTSFVVLFVIIALLALLIPINVILFYARFLTTKSIEVILTWLPLVKLILFAYWLILIFDFANSVLGTVFIVSDCVVWVKQGAYFKLLSKKDNKNSPIDPLFGKRL